MSQLIKTTSEKNEFETSKTYVEHFMQNSILGQANVAKHDYMLLLLMMMMMMMMNCFVVWLTSKRRLALFPAGTIVRDPHHRESSTSREQGLNLCRT